MSHDSLGERMKTYERINRIVHTPNLPIVLRVDGKAFHTLTRNYKKPFDDGFILAMRLAMYETGKMFGGNLVAAYCQSDEATFILQDYRTVETQQFFGGQQQKLVSITAATMTWWFNHYNRPTGGPAVFDCRSFTVPYDEIPNVLLWRMRDWERNSVQMLGQAHFSHSQLQNKSLSDIHDMLHEIGINWADLSDTLKNGSLFINGSWITGRQTYQSLSELIKEQ